MINFNLYVPTKIFFGKDKEKEVGNIIKNYGFKKIMIIFGRGSTAKLVEDTTKLLKDNKIEYVLRGGVSANPKLSFVKETIKIAREEKVELLLAIGGGSVIDTAKSTAAGFYYDGNPFDFNLKKAICNKALPVGVILTIAAAGSELSTSCVITDEESNIKRGFNSDFNRPLFSICNPELTYTVSPYQTACGIVDIMMHTLERYYNPSTEIELADELALGLLRTVYKAGKKVIENPNDYEARATLMISSSMSHAGYTNIGKNAFMPVHQLEHVLSGVYDFVAHGAGLAVLFPAWCYNVYQSDVKKFARFTREVLGVDSCNDEKDAYNGINILKDFFKEIGMPTSLKDLGIIDFDMELFCNMLTNNGTYEIPSIGGNINKEKARKIYECAR